VNNASAATNLRALLASFQVSPDDPNGRLIHSAIRLSAHVLRTDPEQLAVQLLGRLMWSEQPEIRKLLDQAAEAQRGPWLRPLQASLTPAGGPLIATLKGHAGTVHSVAITADSRSIVSASGDQTLKVWDIDGQEEIRTLRGHEGLIGAVALTPDGRQIVSASADKTVRVWDFETGSELRVLHGHTKAVLAVAITPDGRRAISGSIDTTVRVWDLASGATIRVMEGHTDTVNAVAVTSDGRRVISGSSDKTVRTWDLERGKQIDCLKVREGFGWVQGMALIPGDRRLLVRSELHLILFDLGRSKPVRSWEGATRAITSLAVTADGRRAISGSFDATLKIWDLESYADVGTLRGHTMGVSAIAVTRDGRRAVSGSSDGTIRIWDLESSARGREPETGNLLIASDGSWAVSQSADGTVSIWDVQNGRVLRTFMGPAWWGTAVTKMPSDRWALVGSRQHVVYLWDLETGAEIGQLGAELRAETAEVSVDGRWLVVGSADWGDDPLVVWNLEARKQSMAPNLNGVSAVAINADGRTVAATIGSTLKVWNRETSAEICSLPTGARAISISEDGRTIITGSGDKTIRIWDVERAEAIGKLDGHAGPITAVRISRSGRWIVSGSTDNTIRVWDRHNGNEIARFYADAEITMCAVAPDERSIIAGDALQRIHLLRLEGVTAQ
jgi:WD40 repeat protein